MNDQVREAAGSVTPHGARRRRQLIVVAALAAVGIAVFMGYWFFYSRYYQSSDDAYVAADLVQITSEVPGRVITVQVDDTQHVERGQLLVELDPADAQIAMSSAEAELARTVRSIRGVFAEARGLRAQIRSSAVSLGTARQDLTRREAIAADGAVSGEELQHTRDQIAELEAALTMREQNLASTEAQIEHTSIENHPAVLAAAARVREAALALRRTRIRAPVSGTVARRNVQIGSRINAGTPLMAVVPLTDAWIDANLREVQLRDVRVGQPVELHADLYGRGVTYRGRVLGLGAGSGSAFALLPAQNASGNWIKIVQRVPVRIGIDADDLRRWPLRVGLSMQVRIDTHERAGRAVAAELPQKPRAVAVDDAASDDVAQRIAQIIAANAPEPPASKGL